MEYFMRCSKRGRRRKRPVAPVAAAVTAVVLLGLRVFIHREGPNMSLSGMVGVQGHFCGPFEAIGDLNQQGAHADGFRHVLLLLRFIGVVLTRVFSHRVGPNMSLVADAAGCRDAVMLVGKRTTGYCLKVCPQGELSSCPK